MARAALAAVSVLCVLGAGYGRWRKGGWGKGSYPVVVFSVPGRLPVLERLRGRADPELEVGIQVEGSAEPGKLDLTVSVSYGNGLPRWLNSLRPGKPPNHYWNGTMTRSREAEEGWVMLDEWDRVYLGALEEGVWKVSRSGGGEFEWLKDPAEVAALLAKFRKAAGR